MPVSDGIPRRKVTTTHGRYYAERQALSRRKKILLIQLLRRRKGTKALRTSTIKVTKPRITQGEALSILIGTQIGAGVLGLPYAASKVGLTPAVGILLGVMVLMLATALIVLKMSASMKGAQMSTLAERTLGKAGGWAMYVSIFIMSFGALLAYVSGMGSVFANLFGMSPTLGALIFWIFASLVVWYGLEASGKTELVMSFVMLFLFIGAAVMLAPHAKLSNALYTDFRGVLAITGVAIFALGCHTVIPDVYKGLGSYEKTKKVVILAFLIPTAIYSMFMAVFLLAFGRNTPQIATLGLKALYGKLGSLVGNLIPLLAITTSYIGIALAQESNSKEFAKMRKPAAWALTVVPPLVVYLAGIKNFADVLAFAGDTGDLMSFIILPLAMYVTWRTLRARHGKAARA